MASTGSAVSIGSGAAAAVVSTGADSTGSGAAVVVTSGSAVAAADSETPSLTASTMPVAASRPVMLTVDIAARSGSASATSAASSSGESPSPMRILLSSIVHSPCPRVDRSRRQLAVVQPIRQHPWKLHGVLGLDGSSLR